MARTVEGGRLLCREGEPAGAVVHLIESGAVSVSVTARSGRRATIQVLGVGDLLGVEAFEDEPATRPDGSAEARALVDARVLSISTADLRVAMARSPDVAGRVRSALAARVRSLERHVARMQTLPVRERLRSMLSELAEDHGREVPGGVLVDLPLSQELLASLIGATRESVNRALSDLQGRGHVGRRTGRYLLPPQRKGQPSEVALG